MWEARTRATSVTFRQPSSHSSANCPSPWLSNGHAATKSSTKPMTLLFCAGSSANASWSVQSLVVSHAVQTLLSPLPAAHDALNQFSISSMSFAPVAPA